MGGLISKIHLIWARKRSLARVMEFVFRITGTVFQKSDTLLAASYLLFFFFLVMIYLLDSGQQ